LSSKNKRMRTSAATLAVLQAFLANPSEDFYGSELMARCDMRSGTIYPILARLEMCGWLESNWNDIEVDGGLRLRRRTYRLSHVGQAVALKAVADRRPSAPLVHWVHLTHWPIRQSA
jgi:PadR family transcriptional regulator, regulatory protein PadR